MIAITEFPAPTFAEEKRAALVEALFRETRPTSLERDAAGNVLALRRGATGSGPLVVLTAHMDTVFPPGTNVAVRRTGTTLAAPGVGDNAQGVAFLVALSRAMDAAAVSTASDVLLVASVGEEGLGDLAGMKHLFGKGRFKDRIRTFVAIDGVGDGSFVATTAVGSRRYRVTFRGPGGHSFGAFGLVNPAHAVAVAIQKLSATRVPSSPRTTFNVGAIGGGTSVNSIPSSAWMDVDLRSEGAGELDALDRSFQASVAEAAAAENASRSVSEGQITVEITATGARPAGRTAPGSRLVTTASTVWRTMRVTPVFGATSSDANLPMSLGIPAITIDTGLPGGRPHSPDEWVNVDRPFARAGFERLLLLTVSLAGTGGA
jgi:tripeptide aminopeptidase